MTSCLAPLFREVVTTEVRRPRVRGQTHGEALPGWPASPAPPKYTRTWCPGLASGVRADGVAAALQARLSLRADRVPRRSLALGR